MSNQETINLTSIRSAIESYTGFTKGEKTYAIENLNSWVGEEYNLDGLTKNFAKLSLDAKPFLEQTGLVKI